MLKYKHKTRVNGKRTRLYIVWSNMMARCYGKAYSKLQPTYDGCTVCENWKDFQVFAEWAICQKGFADGWHLDKDLTVLGNKTYSPETCAFIPREVNNLLLNTKPRKHSKYRLGVKFEHGKYLAHCCVGGGLQKFLGYFASEEDAFISYKHCKESYIKSVATSYRECLTVAIYNNIISYSIGN